MTLHVTDRLRSRRIRRNEELAAVRHAVEQVGQHVDLAANHPRLIVNVQPAALHIASQIGRAHV